MRTTRALLLAATLLAACGRGGSGEPSAGREVPAPDLSSPEVVLAQAHRALSAGDWPALRAFLTADGRARVEADLKAWHEALRDPVTGPRAAARVPLPADEAGRAVARRAISEGDVAALLWLLVLADPRAALPPPTATSRPPDVTRVELAYPTRRAELRRVILSRDADGWRIDRLQL